MLRKVFKKYTPLLQGLTVYKFVNKSFVETTIIEKLSNYRIAVLKILKELALKLKFKNVSFSTVLLNYMFIFKKGHMIHTFVLNLRYRRNQNSSIYLQSI